MTFVGLITVGGYGSDRVVMNVIGAIVAISRFGFGRSVYSFFLDRRSLKFKVSIHGVKSYWEGYISFPIDPGSQ